MQELLKLRLEWFRNSSLYGNYIFVISVLYVWHINFRIAIASWEASPLVSPFKRSIASEVCCYISAPGDVPWLRTPLDVLISCMQVLKKEYFSNAQQQFSFTFGFENDFVSLEIPKEGLQLDGWKVTPFYNPQVSLPYGG